MTDYVQQLIEQRDAALDALGKAEERAAALEAVAEAVRDWWEEGGADRWNAIIAAEASGEEPLDKDAEAHLEAAFRALHATGWRPRADQAGEAKDMIIGECQRHDYQWAYRADHPKAEIGCPVCASLEIVRLRAQVGACWAWLESLEGVEYVPYDTVRRMLRAALEGDDGL